MMVDEQDPSKTATVADPVDDMDWMISKSEDGALELALETYQEPMAGGFPPGVEHGFQAAMLSEVEAVFESDLPLELPEMEMVVAGSPSFSEEDYPFNDMFSDLDHRLRAAATVALLDAEVAAVDADAVIAERDADVEETTAAPPDTPEPLIVQERHIIFSLTGKRYAVPIRNVIEVGELSNLTPVPNVPAWVKDRKSVV